MAVRHGYGKIAGTDALVFAYDTGDTRNSYKGEPTVNLTTDTPSQGGWDGTYQVLNSSTKAFRFIVSNFAANPGAGWRSFTWDLRAYTGQSVTISATVNVPAASPGTFAWIMMGQGNTYTNNSGAGGYLGYSATSERVYKSTTVEEHITWSGIIGNSGTANQPSGHVGFTIWYNNGTPGINSYVEVSNVQIEIKSHATPFVNGTRSNTQGLLDLTENNTIDLANVSFDSNAQKFFDGTNDYFSLPDGTKWFTNQWSYEIVLKFNGNTGTYQGLLWGEGAVGGGSGYQKLLSFYNYSYFHYRVNNTVTGWVPTDFTPTGFTPTAYNHLVWQFNDGTTQIFINGVLVHTNNVRGAYSGGTTSPLYIGVRNDLAYDFNGEIPVLKRYSRTLTAAEVRNNYNQYKGRFNL